MSVASLNILQQSPHDLQPPKCSEPVLVETGPELTKWVPSRYNVRANTEDGRLVLWNSYRCTMSVFGAKQSSTVKMLLSQKGFEGRTEGLVKYLADRGYLVERGTDEYKRIQLRFGQQQYRTNTLQLILLASEDCNFRCTYCYEDFARGTMQPSVREGIKQLVRNRVSSLRNLSISWFGGEPLYGFQAIEDLAPFFVEIAEENDLYYHSGMTTNGYLLTPDMADKLLAWNIKKFQITIDGPPENHDKSRPTRDGQGTFQTIFNNLEAMRNRSDEFGIDIRINFDRQNYPQLDSFLDLIEERFGGDERFRLRMRAVGRWGGPNDQDLDVCGAKESEEAKRELIREARLRGLRVTDDLRDIKGLGAEVCYAARPYNFIIGATGKVMKCTIDLDQHDRNVIGELTQDGRLMLDQDKFALWTEPAFENDSQCKKCVVLPTCQGVHCPQIRIRDNKSPCTPLRMNVKHELRELVETVGDRARKVKVRQTPSLRKEPAGKKIVASPPSA